MATRYYCNVCTCWLPNDLFSIRSHENGRQHKEKVNESIQKRTILKQKEKQDQLKTDRLIQRIERKATESVRNDIQNGHIKDIRLHSTQEDTTTIPPPPPPPPPPVSSTHRHTSLKNRKRSIPKKRTESEPIQYMERGRTYIEGKSIENYLIPGIYCEVLNLVRKNWIPSKIVDIVRRYVPPTGKELRTFRIRRYLPKGWREAIDPKTNRSYYGKIDSSTTSWTPPNIDTNTSVRHIVDATQGTYELRREIEEVTAERIRLCPAAAPRTEDTTAVPAEDPPSMMGRWETVEEVESSTTVDEIDTENASISTFVNEKDRQREYVNAPNVGETDAYDTLNPWGGDYRGFDVKSADAERKTLQDESAERDGTDAPQPAVSFRKRSAASSKNPFGSRKRRKRRSVRTPTSK